MLKETTIPNLKKPVNSVEEDSKQRCLPVGIDPGKDTCGVAMLHPDSNNGTVLKSFLMDNCSFEDACALTEKAEEVSKPFDLKPVFVIEATNVFWRPLFSYLKRRGYPVETVNSFQTKSSRGTRMRKTKTDLIDAKHIASLYKQGKSHPTEFPEGIRMNLRELVRLHSFLADAKGRLLNRIYGYLFQVFPEFTSLFDSNCFIATMWALLREELVHPYCLQKVRIDKLTRILKKASKGKFGKEKAIRLKKAARSSFGMPEGRKGFSSALRILANLYRFFEETISTLENEEIWPLSNQIPNRLNTIKGMGIGAAYFLAESKKPEDFSNASDVLAWFGLDPRLDQSGKHKGTGKRISKCGTKYGREAMFLVAERTLLHIPQVLAKYRRLRKNKRTDREAKTIITADLVKACYAMQRDNAPFNPSLIH